MMQKHPLDHRYQFLLIEVPLSSSLHHAIVVVTLNRPQKLNAIHAPLWREIGDCFGRLGRTGDGCRCILLRGSGRGFCAGIDLADLSFTDGTDTTTNNNNTISSISSTVSATGTRAAAAAAAAAAADPARKGLSMASKIQQMQACFTQLETCPVPVVVALHGCCIGGGIDLACCADIRICYTGTTFSVREVRMGLAADVGTLQRLPKITGNESWVRDVCLTGRNFDSNEALQNGLVSQVISDGNDPSTQLLKHGIRLCQTIAANSRVAVVGTKKALLYARDHTVADSLEQIISYNVMALQSEDLPQSIRAAKEKRQANFPNLWKQSRL